MTPTTCPKCDGEKRVEMMHPRWGTRDCPEAYVMAECPECEGKGKVDLYPILFDLLHDVRVVVDDLAANGDNEAARLLHRIENAIDRLEDLG